jgi:predicted protein tyrosine phosphatase
MGALICVMRILESQKESNVMDAIIDTVVLSRMWFEQQEFFNGDAIISIASPEYSHPRPNSKLPRLNIQFHDVVAEILIGNTLWLPMTESQAEVLVDWALTNVIECDRLIIHCDAGISRSPGVAIGLARYFPLIEENELRDKYPHFNILVALRIWNECERRGMKPIENRPSRALSL